MAGAARVGDPHLCPATSPNPHIGGPVMPPASLDVQTSGMAQARAGDQALCGGSPAPDFIVTGSGTVLIGDKPAARMGDKTMHGGAVIFGDANVQIYGPTVGVALGATAAGYAACTSMAAGRNPPAGEKYPSDHPLAGKEIAKHTNKNKQSYSNCGIESVRQLINYCNPGNPIDQESLLDKAMDKGWADREKTRYKSGSTYPSNQAELLTYYGVPAHTELGTIENLQQAVAEGKGVIASVGAGTLWGDASVTGNHAVVVTGIEYDENGQLKNVIINDTGQGTCGQSIPAATFAKALRDYNETQASDAWSQKHQMSMPVTRNGLVVTHNSLWGI